MFSPIAGAEGATSGIDVGIDGGDTDWASDIRQI